MNQNAGMKDEASKYAHALMDLWEYLKGQKLKKRYMKGISVANIEEKNRESFKLVWACVKTMYQ